jgi:hypothetical protein
VPAVALRVLGVVVAVLAHEQGVGGSLVHRQAHLPGDVVVEVLTAVAARHVGHVDPPAVEGAVAGDPAAHHAVLVLEDAVAQRRAVVVELGQGGDAEPRDVLLALPEVVAALLGVGVLLGGDEPLVGVAGVVRGEVAQDPHAALVRCVDQAAEGVVAAEHGVDLVEARGVIAVVGAGGEERRQVDDGGAELGDVVQPLGDAVEVAAEQLPGDDTRLQPRRLVPAGGDGPVRDLPGVLPRGPGEPVREDLVDHGLAGPGRRGPEGRQPEVGGVRDVPLVHAGAVEPLVCRGAALEDEPVVRDEVVAHDLRRPPRLRLGGALDGGVGEDGLGVGGGAHVDRGDVRVAGHTDPDGDALAERRVRVGDVER